MRKLANFLLAAVLTLSFGCGSSDQSEHPQEKSSREGGAPEDKPDGKPGQKGGMGDIDIDKLDIPEQMKEAIKSGKIPPDQLKSMLARYQGGGDAELGHEVVPQKKREAV